MTTKKSARIGPATRRRLLDEIATRAFGSAFREALESAALCNPRGLLRTATAEYLTAMRARLEWLEREWKRGAGAKVGAHTHA